MLLRLLTPVVETGSRRPRTTLLIAAIVVALSILVLSRIRIDSTLSGMLGGDNPAAEALARITDDFRAAEDLLVFVAAPSSLPVPDAQQLLLEYAQRLEDATSSPAVADAGITRVRYRPDPAFETYFRETVLPAATLWLDDDAFAALLHRLTPAEVRAQLDQNATMLAVPGPAASALAKQLVKDPLRLREFLMARFAHGPLITPGADFSDDGRALLIRVSGARPVNDIEYSKRFTAAVRQLADQVNTTGLEVRLGGGYAVAATTATVIRRDAIVSTISSVLLIHLFLAIAYRQFLAPFTIMVTAAAGVVAAFAVYTLLVHSITPLTAVLAAMLAGLGVDYVIHFRSHHDSARLAGDSPVEASLRTTRELAGPLTVACLTSIFGFATAALSDVRMLKDFALLGSIGLAGVLIAVWCILPAALALIPAAPRAPAKSSGFAGFIVTLVTVRPLLSVAVGVAMGVAATVAILTTPGFAPAFETDPSVLHPHPNAPLETGRIIRDRFSAMGESLFIRVVADSHGGEELAERGSHQVSDRLATPEAAAAGVSYTLGLASLVPDPSRVPDRLKMIDVLDVDEILGGVVHEIVRSDFEPTAFDDYINFLRQLLTTRGGCIPTVANVLRSPELARLILPARSVDDPAVAPRQALVLVRATSAASDRAARAEMIERIRSLIDDLPGVTLTGLIVVSHDLETAARRDLILFSALSTGLVAVWLFLLLRRPADVALAFIPVVFSILCIFGMMAAIGARFNPVNVVAFSLLSGVADNSGIFLVAIARQAAKEGTDLREALRPTIHAIICTATTSALGFGALIWTHTPAVSSLGFLILVGMFSSLAACLLIVAPLLVRRSFRMNRSAA